ncbi:MAG: F0F1 ATP synthase subunit A [Defluviitaleaceae bacterium]|nr:F0F1 ATP synthase subunit A [Defluviitaleaceae bacterium]
MDFENRVVTSFQLFGQEVWITQTQTSTWLVMIVLILIALYVRATLKKFAEVPENRKQNIIEAIIEVFDNFVKSVMGEENRKYAGWFFGVFVYIISANFSGLFGVRPPTADIAATLALSITTFLVVTGSAIVKAPKEYFKGLLQPFPVFLPMNLFSEFSIVISLAFRLFGNILSGLVITSILYYLVAWPVVVLGLFAPIHAYFDIFAGAMQALIFTMLSMIFVKNKI